MQVLALTMSECAGSPSTVQIRRRVHASHPTMDMAVQFWKDTKILRCSLLFAEINEHLALAWGTLIKIITVVFSGLLWTDVDVQRLFCPDKCKDEPQPR